MEFSRAEQPYGTAMPALMFFAIRQLLHSLLLLQFVSSPSHVETFVVRLIFLGLLMTKQLYYEDIFLESVEDLFRAFDVKKEGRLTEKDISASLFYLAEFLPNLQPAPLKDRAKAMPNMTIEETYRNFTSTTTLQRLVNGFIEALKSSYCIREMEETQQVVTSYDLSLRGDLVKYTLVDFLFAFRQSEDLQQRIFSPQNFEAALTKDISDCCFKTPTRVLGTKEIKKLIEFSANKELDELHSSDEAGIQRALDNVGQSEDGGPGVVKMSVFLSLDQRKP